MYIYEGRERDLTSLTPVLTHHSSSHRSLLSLKGDKARIKVKTKTFASSCEFIQPCRRLDEQSKACMQVHLIDEPSLTNNKTFAPLDRLTHSVSVDITDAKQEDHHSSCQVAI
jgi:hypothetical protein